MKKAQTTGKQAATAPQADGKDEVVCEDKKERGAAPFVARRVGNGELQLEPLNVVEHERREPPPTLPRPPFMAGLFGSRGSGKTTAMLNLLRLYDTVECFDKTYIFSPTHAKDPKFEAFVNSKPYAQIQFFERYTDVQFDQITRDMEKELADYEQFKIALTAYEKFCKGKKIDDMTPDELLALYQYDFNDPAALSRFKRGRPCYCIVFDDMVGDKNVYRGDSCGLVGRFALRHRHFNCSIFFLSQAYRNGVPRQLRNNLSLAVFFANKSDRMKVEISEDMASFVSPETFIAMWDYACEEPHAFLMIDYDAADPSWRFRKNFDTLLVVSEEEEKREEAEDKKDGKPAPAKSGRPAGTKRKRKSTRDSRKWIMAAAKLGHPGPGPDGLWSGPLGIR